MATLPYAVSALMVALLEEEDARITAALISPLAVYSDKFGRGRREEKIPRGGSSPSGIRMFVSITQVSLIDP